MSMTKQIHSHRKTQTKQTYNNSFVKLSQNEVTGRKRQTVDMLEAFFIHSSVLTV